MQIHFCSPIHVPFIMRHGLKRGPQQVLDHIRPSSASNYLIYSKAVETSNFVETATDKSSKLVQEIRGVKGKGKGH